MATEQTLTTLIINKVDSKETFNKMKAQGLVNENELYLTPEGAVTEQQIKVQNDEPTNSATNDLWLDLDEDAPASLPISGGTLTGPLAMSNNKITGVGNPTSAQDAVTLGYLQNHFVENEYGTVNQLTIDGTLIFNGEEQVSLENTTGHAITVYGNLDNVNVLVPTKDTDYVQKEYVDTMCSNRESKTQPSSSTGSIVQTLNDHYDYTFNNVSSLNLTAGTGSCHGFITFGSSKPTVSLSGFTKVDGDIANAAASTVWEFSCYNKYIIFKNWSDV